MAAKRKHRSTNEYLKYLKGELSPEERHSFERDLEADPFEMEAMEGMEKLPAGDVEEDLLSLHARLGSRLKRRRRNTWYYVAATVASILIVGTVFVNLYDFNPRTTPESLPADGYFQDEAPEAVDAAGLEEEVEVGKQEAPEERTRVEETEYDLEMAAEKPVIIDEPVKMEEPVKVEEPLIAEEGGERKAEAAGLREEPAEAVAAVAVEEQAAYDEEPVSADELVVKEAEPGRSQKKGRARDMAAPVSYAAEQADDHMGERIGGIVISTEDMEPLPGASIVVKGSDSGMVADMYGRFSLVPEQQEQTTIIASYVGMLTNEYQLASGTENRVLMQPDLTSLNEVVVIGYDADKSQYTTGAVQTINLKQEEITYSGAEPEGGLQAYKMYIEEHIRFPAGDTLSKKEVVVLKFQVEKDGSVSGIQTLRSPGNSYTEEAIRLLNEGPAWNPARNKSGIIEDVVRMRIVFKK